MNVVILHYHLNRGGVGQVVRHHLKALDIQDGHARPRILLLFGGRCLGWSEDYVAPNLNLDVQLVVVPELDYSTVHSDSSNQDEPLTQKLLRVLEGHGCHPSDTIIHAHNHALGKNVDATSTCRELARHGFALLLHIHDFAEDFRPENYQCLAAAFAPHNPASVMYPQASHIHYAVLNSRDYETMKRCGVEAQRLHLLRNPVSPPSAPPRPDARAKLEQIFGIPPDTCFALYPVRAIRRKNIGEIFLWSAALQRQASFGITMQPLDPTEHAVYLQWINFARGLGLSCYFELGNAPNWELADNIAAADRIVTTSVAEGFGMVFLEAWLANRMLIGRDLPEVTANLREADLQLNSLYSELFIPREWISWPDFLAQVAQEFHKTCLQFGREYDRTLVDAACRDWWDAGGIDFARLPTRMQREVITSVNESKTRREQLLQLNPQLNFVDQTTSAALIHSNAASTSNGFSLESCGDQLAQLYELVLQSPRGDVSAPAHCGAVLDAFLDFRRFHAIRVER